MTEQQEYSSDEIQQAQSEESGLAQQALLQALQQRNVILNIEVRRAQKRVAELEAVSTDSTVVV
jgi:hypothetical protein